MSSSMCQILQNSGYRSACSALRKWHWLEFQGDSVTACGERIVIVSCFREENTSDGSLLCTLKFAMK